VLLQTSSIKPAPAPTRRPIDEQYPRTDVRLLPTERRVVVEVHGVPLIAIVRLAVVGDAVEANVIELRHLRLSGGIVSLSEFDAALEARCEQDALELI
jgi:hypothetical protein